MSKPKLKPKFKPITLAELQRNGRRFAEAAERSPWTRDLRAALATGDQRLIDAFVRRFKQAEALRYSTLK
jgi:hypothetical protein